jgi:hypothetical protein
MSPQRLKAPRNARGAQQWILSELRSIGSRTSLSTAQVAERISRSSGRKFHVASVYLALRTLEDRGDIKSERLGRNKVFRVTDAAYARESASPPKTKTSGNLRSARALPIAMPQAVQDFGERASNLAHKLALGEILVLEIEDRQVLTATNLHGRLSLDRHAFPDPTVP